MRRQFLIGYHSLTMFFLIVLNFRTKWSLGPRSFFVRLLLGLLRSKIMLLSDLRCFLITRCFEKPNLVDLPTLLLPTFNR